MKMPWAILLCALPAFGQPHIASVVSAADSQGGIALGGLITVYGAGMSDAVHLLAALPYPTKMGPTEILLCINSAAKFASDAGCFALGLTYVSATQINAYLPESTPPLPGFGATGLSFVVRNAGIIDDDAAAGRAKVFSLNLPEPRIFSEGFDCPVDPRFKDANISCGLTFTSTLPLRMQVSRGAITDQHGTVLSSSNRARIGQYYSVWLTGVGPLKNGAPVVPVSMTFSNIPAYGYAGTTFYSATLLYAGPSSQYPGLDQINFQLPSSVAEGKGPGYGSLFPCGDYEWEISLEVSQSQGSPANVVQIPVSVKNGDIACAR